MKSVSVSALLNFNVKVAATPSLLGRWEFDYRLKNAVTNEIIRLLLEQGGSEGVQVQLWTEQVKSDPSALGRDYYDVLRLKFVGEEQIVSIPTPLLAEKALVRLQTFWEVVNMHQAKVATGAYDTDREDDGPEEVVKVTIYSNQNILWQEFVSEFLTDENYTNLSPKLGKVLREKVRKIRRQMESVPA